MSATFLELPSKTPETLVACASCPALQRLERELAELRSEVNPASADGAASTGSDNAGAKGGSSPSISADGRHVAPVHHHVVGLGWKERLGDCHLHGVCIR